EAGAIGNKVLPAELISDPEPVMCIRIHEIEGVVNAVRRILVSAGKVVAAEDPRHPSQRREPVTDTKCRRPGADIIVPGGPPLPDHFEPIVEIVDLFAPQPESKGLFVKFPCLA